ncbi:alpha-2-macroglobulin [Chitinophaga terrae (ex Kim and Jung 2007)]|nr:alpha-2-macroglobulin [Chitinophaga terrae (ex Kim and Jung 2007)]
MAQFNFKDAWKQVDAYNEKQLPKSAAKVVDDIYNHAKKEKNYPEQIKALVNLLNYASLVEDSSLLINYERINKEIAASSGTPQAILQSLKAEMLYWYFQNNRYKFYNRTTVRDDKDADITTWTSEKFLKQIGTDYQASIANAATLKKVKVSDYDTIIVKGTATGRAVRPTLYDLLAHRALGFFKTGEAGIRQPANLLQVKDPAAFAPAAQFAAHTFQTPDSSSLQYQAILIFQDLIRFHAGDAAALLDVDAERIGYMNTVAVMPDKNQLYLAALETVMKQYGDQPGVTGIYALLANHYLTLSYENQQDSLSLIKAREYAEKGAKLAPKTAGAVQCRQIIAGIDEKNLNITTEQVNVPGKPFRALVTYKNVGKLYLRLVKVSEDLKKKIDKASENYKDPEEYYRILLAQNPVRSWEQDLPEPKDYREHSAEIKIDELPVGQYALVSGNGRDFNLKSDAVTTQLFWVSAISYISNQDTYYVLDRTTGKPLAGAQLDIYIQERGKTPVKDTSYVAGKDGSLKVKRARLNYYQNRLFVWNYGNDKLALDDALPYAPSLKAKKEFRTVLFTDRQIYRPGQTVYFKGIVTEKGVDGTSTIQPNYRTTLTLFDANASKVDSIQLVTNEYGSYSGKFVLPEGKLNGYFRLADEKANANTGFQVEEYKRPKFYVNFDTLNQQVRLGDNVTVKGKAVAYAGNNIDGATVKYTVSRSVRYPYPWMFWKVIAPVGNSREIANGEAVTKADGSFEIRFPALPDESVDKSTKPIFTYSIHADVTDLNGETRSADERLNVGYQSLELKIEASDKLDKEQLAAVKVFSQGLNGNFLQSNVTLTISPLEPVKRLIRPRYWQMPDQFVMDEASYIRNFPADLYRNENDPATWPRKEAVVKQTIVTKADGSVDWTKLKLAPGFYELQVTTTDQYNESVTQKTTFELVDPAAKTLTVPAYLALQASDKAVEPGNTATYSLATSVKDLYVLELKARRDNQLERNNLYVDGSRQFSIPVKESDRGNIIVAYAAVRDNRVLNVMHTVMVPWTNKMLDVKLATHRDKLLPGEKEKWTVNITGNKGSKVAAEMVANMYDASLDAFVQNRWGVPDWTPFVTFPGQFAGTNNFTQSTSRLHINYPAVDYGNYDIRYDELLTLTPYVYLERMSPNLYGSRAAGAPAPAAITRMTVQAREKVMLRGNSNIQTQGMLADLSAVALDTVAAPAPAAEVPLRSNFQETAFFYPNLRTDESGNIIFEFTMPESLTKWNFMAAAHTKELAYGTINTSIVTQKTLMVAPNAPRFVREGDKINFTAKVSNLADSMLIGQARLELLDAATMQPVDGWFQNLFPVQHFTAQAGQSTVVSFPLQVPRGFKSALLYRVVAQAGNFSDGEENALPVLSNSMLVTEALPLQSKGDGNQAYKFEKLLHSDSSSTLQQKGITVEYTSNPAWYAVQALPYLMEYPYQCAEQVFNRYYANAIAGHIVNNAPGIKAVFDKWKTTDTAALMSNLQKNEELKSVLLEQTPWVLEAKSEAEQKRNIALLFDLKKMSASLDKAISELAEKQLADGSFPWFAGLYTDRFITQYIVAGIGHMQKITGRTDAKANEIAVKAIEYLDKQLDKDYHQLLKSKAKMTDAQITNYQVHYLYARSFFNVPAPADMNKTFDYYYGQAAKYWTRQGIYSQGMLALLLNRKGDTKTAADIIRSLKERAINNAERGMYWKEVESGYSWYQAPIETGALMVEAFSEIGKNDAEVTGLKTWLLKNKQTSNWKTTKATADAVYALLLKGDNWLSTNATVNIKLGNTAVKADRQEAGTGYIRQQVAAKDVKPEMGNIEVAVSGSNGQPSWGAVYWQYFEELDKISFAKTPLAIEKTLYKVENTAKGAELTRIDEHNELKVGDKVKVRIVLRADRPMEYIHLRDMRAACFEPVDVISAARWQDGLGYYQSTKDASMDFFFNSLDKGTHVFEYTMFVTHTGKYSNGVSIAECMYAPEFSSHSEGINVKVIE